MRFVLLIVLLLFTGCSFKSKQHDIWRKNSSNSFESYRKYFLMGKNQMALVSLKRAIESAKSSANMTPLSKVYLGVCALHVAVLMDDKCKAYLSLSDLIDEKDATHSYYYMLQKRYDNVDISKIPAQYREFVLQMKKANFQKAIAAAKDMKNMSSMLISFSLLKTHLKAEDVDFLIHQLSIYGYKRALISWLKYSKKLNSDEKNRKIDKILNIIK